MKKSPRINILLLIPLLVIIIPVSLRCFNPDSVADGWDQVPQILNQIVPPEFPDRDFFITNYGAIGDGKFDCTEAIKLAIEACHTAGGGRVIVPEGIFLTGAIHLKNNVNLHLADNARLLFSTDAHKYLPVVQTRYEGVECLNYSPLIYAYDQYNLAITGTGVLDGQADSSHWWDWAEKVERKPQQSDLDYKPDRDRLFQMGEENLPVRERVFGQDHFLRTSFIQFYMCQNILIEGVTIERSPMWNINPVLCENVTVSGVRVISHGPNNDGCNPESSKNVLIQGCYFDTGDDCIAIKSGRNGDGRRINTASENIIIQDCIMRDGHGGVVIGSETSGNCRNIFAQNCTMDSPNLERALRIKTNSLRGGIVENIYMRNVIIGNVSDAVVRIYFLYGEGDAGRHTPVVRDIFIENVTSQSSNYALYLEGYERSPITNINFMNCQFKGVKNKNIINHVTGLKMTDVYINEIKQ
jgi:polygalacturonase